MGTVNSLLLSLIAFPLLIVATFMQLSLSGIWAWLELYFLFPIKEHENGQERRGERGHCHGDSHCHPPVRPVAAHCCKALATNLPLPSFNFFHSTNNKSHTQNNIKNHPFMCILPNPNKLRGQPPNLSPKKALRKLEGQAWLINKEFTYKILKLGKPFPSS